MSEREGYEKYADELAAIRNGPSKVPADPIERKRWAHEMAAKQGWIAEREPGSDDE